MAGPDDHPRPPRRRRPMQPLAAVTRLAAAATVSIVFATLVTG